MPVVVRLPFGYEVSVGSIVSPKNEYLYNKKELQEELGQYDYGARFYDPVIARWSVVDTYAEHPDQIDLSPYAYVGNNPILKDDPDGNCPNCDVPEEDDFLRYATEADKMMHPTRAAIYNVSVGILDGIGVRDLVRSLEHLGDKDVSTGTKVVKVLNAAINVMPVDREGEKEPQLKNIEPDIVTFYGKKVDPKTGQTIGPSGKPEVHTVEHPSMKRAKDAAREGGNGTPVKHTKDAKGGSHYRHGSGVTGKGKGTKDYETKAGKVSDNVHHEYPK